MQELKNREIGIWIWSLEAPELQLEEARELLSPDELGRAARFLKKRDQDRFVACRVGLRRVLGGILGKNPKWLCFEYGASGKPSLACQRARGGLKFNLSHSGDAAMLVAAYGLELGADLEYEDGVKDTAEMADLAFSPVELAWLMQDRESERQSAFFEIWTMKEAVLKAKALGLAEGFKNYHVLPDGEGSGQILHGVGDPDEDWRVHSFSPAPALHAAIAYVHPGGAEFIMAPKAKLDYPYASSIFGGEKAHVEFSLHL